MDSANARKPHHLTRYGQNGTPQGKQAPRVNLVPEGEEHPDTVAALEFVAAAGIRLDPWQTHVLRSSLLRREGRWAAFAVGVCAPRQNGKNAITEARELLGPLILGENLVIHSAHLADTSKEAFRRLEILLEANEWLSKEVRHIWRTNGHEAVEFRDGRRIRFRTRSKGGGRGFSGAPIILDEAQMLPIVSVGAILPVVSAQPDPQVWYAGSAVDQFVHEDGIAWARVRERALRAEPGLAYFEWSLDAGTPDDVTPEMATNPELWAEANPALGIRIDHAYVADEQRELDPRTFAVERLGVGDWPVTDATEHGPISPEAWDSLGDPDSVLTDPICIAFDVAPDRSRAALAAAGKSVAGYWHVETVEHRRGTGWLVPKLVEIVESQDPTVVVCDATGPAASLIAPLEEAGVRVETVTVGEHGQAVGRLVDMVAERTLRHLGTEELAAAVRGVKPRPLGDAYAWSRKNSAVDISPLVAATLALGAAAGVGDRGEIVIY